MVARGVGVAAFWRLVLEETLPLIPVPVGQALAGMAAFLTMQIL
jgi:hypothetical protein